MNISHRTIHMVSMWIGVIFGIILYEIFVPSTSTVEHIYFLTIGYGLAWWSAFTRIDDE